MQIAQQIRRHPMVAFSFSGLLFFPQSSDVPKVAVFEPSATTAALQQVVIKGAVLITANVPPDAIVYNSTLSHFNFAHHAGSQQSRL
jgi:hypothetical protein